MVRENTGYSLQPRVVAALRRAAADFAALGVDGLVIGFARLGRPAVDDVARVLEAAPTVAATFHRAFDTLDDPLAAIDVIAGIRGVDRILTGGGGGAAAIRAGRLRQYSARAGDRLTVVAGGGVDENAAAMFARLGCVRELHVGRAAREDDDPDGPVSAARVHRLRTLAPRERP